MESWSTCTSNCINESYANQDQGLPPGFRFHPTDEELVTHYLANKIDNPNFSCRAVSEADLNKSEPWELPGKAHMGEKEWYFFSARDRKYPTGMRTNRATEAGYWKATGKDREVVSSSGSGSAGRVVGMKKTLVFYRGRAPKGLKTNWVMHEYRNEGQKLMSSRASSSHSKDEWVVCRIFHKSPGGKKMGLSELRQGSHMTSDNGATLYATSLPALLDSPVPTGSSGGRSDQENIMFNALLHYNNSAIKSEATTYASGSSLFNCTSMASLMARSNVTTSMMPSYTSTTSTPSLLSSTRSGHMSHNATANVVGVPNQRASYPHSSQGVSSPTAIMSNTFNNRNSPHNIGTLTPSNDHNNQHHLSSMQYVNPTPYIDPMLNITPTSLAPPLSHLPSDLDTFWLYSDRV